MIGLCFVPIFSVLGILGFDCLVFGWLGLCFCLCVGFGICLFVAFARLPLAFGFESLVLVLFNLVFG